MEKSQVFKCKYQKEQLEFQNLFYIVYCVSEKKQISFSNRSDLV
jgi:hypothetical protein